MRGLLISVNRTTIGFVKVVILKYENEIRIETTQKNTNNGDNSLTLLVTTLCLV